MDLEGIMLSKGLPGRSVDKEPIHNTGNIGDTGLNSESGRSPGRGNGNPLQFSCLENPIDKGAQKATVHEVAKSWT